MYWIEQLASWHNNMFCGHLMKCLWMLFWLLCFCFCLDLLGVAALPPRAMGLEGSHSHCCFLCSGNLGWLRGLFCTSISLSVKWSHNYCWSFLCISKIHRAWKQSFQAELARSIQEHCVLFVYPWEHVRLISDHWAGPKICISFCWGLR